MNYPAASGRGIALLNQCDSLRAFVDELIEWLRFNKRDTLAAMDGLYSVCSGNPEVPDWLGQMFVAGTKPQQQADVDAKKLRSSSAAVVITSETDDKVAWIRTGQVYERLALQTTALGIKSAFLNQPIEVSELRSQFQRYRAGHLPAAIASRAFWLCGCHAKIHAPAGGAGFDIAENRKMKFQQ